jgi:hypothetical protein
LEAVPDDAPSRLGAVPDDATSDWRLFLTVHLQIGGCT